MTTRAFNPLSRRQWLKSSGLVAGGAIATQSLSPALLPALEAPAAPAVVNGQTTLDGFLALEREIEAMRRADGPIRLASNENPYGMAPSAKQAINDMWKEHAWYGAAAVPELRKIYAKQMGVPEDYVLVTAGSGDVLSIVALAYAMQGGEVLTPWPTYEGLPRYAEALGARVHKVALDGDLAHDLEAMERRHVQSVDLVFVCNPNNPTGTLTDSAKLRAFVSNASRKSVVLVDEAYHDFVTDPGYTSMIDLVKAGENVIISRTASKIHGLAGLRTGFAIARPDIIARLQPCVTSFPGVFGARAAAASLQDTAYQNMCRDRNSEGRAIMQTAVKALGRRMTSSHTNFVFFDTGMPVEKVQEAMLTKGFLIGRAFPPYTTWARISIGTPDEMKRVAAVLPEIVKPATTGQ
ncbi:pyridoxal phosphate-dependent aminotransferase [Gemmatimonas sp.]|uniref:pyridoxal phosphate-dependent aminotransferase n=1 Tax=Gemmatimonas sp. TaxID=1962908 RepID=UPI003F6EA932